MRRPVGITVLGALVSLAALIMVLIGIDVGGIEGARWLEATVPLWVLVGQRLGRWDHAFRVVHG